MRKIIIPVCVLIVLASVGALFLRGDDKTPEVCNPGQSLAEWRILTSTGVTLRVEVASDGVDKARGLSGRNCLGQQEGMLFTYGLPGDYCFWMKDMKFPIDMVWLDDDKKIVTIKDNVSPDTYPQSFCPDRPAQYIVEVDAGMAAAYEWQVGTTLDFSL